MQTAVRVKPMIIYFPDVEYFAHRDEKTSDPDLGIP